jgi:hypothetical protein
MTRRLGVLGTLVWDRIVPADGGEIVEAWGGIAYSLEAASAALAPDWEVVPLVRVGADLAPAARALLGSIPRLGRFDGVRIVPEPNNRVELRYHDAARRCERLTGGVPAWPAPELLPLVDELDALYVNFISGHEMELATARSLRSRFSGPIWADLHSLFLHTAAGGRRELRRPVQLDGWLACFDAVQLNEDELATVAGAGVPMPDAARGLLASGPRLAAVTLGGEGAVCFTDPGRPPSAFPSVGGNAELVVPALSEPGDPTGCGDVWGVTAFARLLAGDPAIEAFRRANQAAARKLGYRGAAGLGAQLRAEHAESSGDSRDASRARGAMLGSARPDPIPPNSSSRR